MKRLLTILLAGILCCAILPGCSNTPRETTSPVVQESASPEPVAPENDVPVSKPDDEIVDLTKLSSTMVYSQVYNMMIKPEEYIGKTIKMKGVYYANYNPDLDVYYHFVIIKDATACCAQGLEFILNGEHTDRSDYPASQTPVEVTGIWGSYEEEWETYYYIAADQMTVL